MYDISTYIIAYTFYTVLNNTRKGLNGVSMHLK